MLLHPFISQKKRWIFFYLFMAEWHARSSTLFPPLHLPLQSQILFADFFFSSGKGEWVCLPIGNRISQIKFLAAGTNLHFFFLFLSPSLCTTFLIYLCIKNLFFFFLNIFALLHSWHIGKEGGGGQNESFCEIGEHFFQLLSEMGSACRQKCSL